MPFEAPENRLETFFESIQLLSPERVKDAFMNEIMDAGGTYAGADAEVSVSCLFEISLHEVLAYGRSEEDAIKNWLDAARARLQEQAQSAEADEFAS